jgi:hypothetical protein
MLTNLGLDRPIVGGVSTHTTRRCGVNTLQTTTGFAPRTAYFSVLGEHGFVGLALFLLLWFVTEIFAPTTGEANDFTWIAPSTHPADAATLYRRVSKALAFAL